MYGMCECAYVSVHMSVCMVCVYMSVHMSVHECVYMVCMSV